MNKKNTGDIRRDNFVRLANNRVNRAIRDIRLIGNLSNRATYAHTEDDVRKILKVLQREVDAIRVRFTGSGGSKDADFNLEP